MPDASSPWHPIDDGIAPIVAALQGYVNTPPTGIRGRLPYLNLSCELDKPALQTGFGTTGRREALRRWLQFKGLSSDATECAARLKRVLDLSRAWAQQTARNAPVPETESGPSQEDFDALLEDRDAFMTVCDEAEETANYLAQLAMMLRARLAKTDGAAKRAAPRKGGRPSDTDHEADAKLAELWESGRYHNRAELAHAKEKTVREVKLALERVRDRKRRKSVK